MEKGIVTSSTKKRLDELEILQVDLENKILIEQSKLTVQVSKNDIVAYIRNALKEDSRDMIDLLVDKIILYDDKIEIYFNYIDSKNPDDEHRDLLFYDGTTLLPKIIQNKPKPVMIEIGLKIIF